ncbi:hypothetical protein COX24_03600 [bacterium (Candidatus Gribaldobacteria) CG23_combo_of_CG06-09_8_20_14_all_37_87_8]|uniref:DUF5659 domain-containing protein n=1 Tax=bacterium (Candidatus Gribaldobacteria) CG23_combo_of_CG06-09_8_20_14_all_37_87_8 TaxID=2014278 RepID=A0A2G9ZE33_9BACT|nr:MAG: hypothetical protein COX24_03600 [bacterium (Candidatus Gribaldobacteria) CG23_combo_of_CG06-09_8_20_14_all_37_87_8]
MNQLKLNKNLYFTSDLSLATTASLFFPIEDIDRSNPRKAVFIFRKTPELEKLVDQYFRNEIKISPQTYFNQLRVIKARLYANE